MPYERRRSRSHRLRRKVMKGAFMILGLVAMGGVWWWLAQLGPRALPEEPGLEEEATEASDLAVMRQEVAALAQASLREETSAGTELLQEAIAKQQALVAKLGAGVSQAELRRLQELEEALASSRAMQANPRIALLVTRAEAAREEGDVGGAETIWREALALQRAVNRSGAASVAKNFVRESKIEQSLQAMAAQPLGEEVHEALGAARGAVERERWGDALAAFTAAREGQIRINADFPRSPYASLTTLDEIEREITSLDAAGIAAEVDDREAAGDVAMAETRYEAAVNAYEEARQAQLRLNREFSRSRFLSSPRVEILEVKRQTASSVPLLESLRLEVVAIDQLLVRRESAKAAERIRAAAERMEVLFEQLPKSERLDPALRLRLGFLASRHDRLSDIQDTVYQRLRPLPGVGELQLLRTEIPQSLYLQVMRTNPSRTPGREYPVDSVNWFDAESFCERLSWVLARVARLPTADEFRVAIGDPAAADLAVEESGAGGESRAMAMRRPNAAGFFDLLGNLAEWLAPQGDQTAIWSAVAGGSYLDGAAVLRKVPVVDTLRTERARHIGFRVVVEIPAE